MTPHQTIRQISLGELGLVDYSDRVMALGVVEGRHAGPTVLVQVRGLVACLRELPESIHTVVVLDDPDPDVTLAPMVGDMLAQFGRKEVEVLAMGAPVTEAVKRVRGDLVIGGVSRTSLATIRCPEVIDRASLTAAVEGWEEPWANPTGLVAARGGRIRLYRAPGGDDGMSETS